MKTELIESIIKDYTKSDNFIEHEFDYLDVTFIAHDYSEAVKPKWIPVIERLPELNTDVQVSDGIQVKQAWFGKRTKNDEPWFRFTLIQVTHWQPLPEPPPLP